MSRMFAGGRLVVATHNEGKAREIGELLAPYSAEAVSAGALGLPVPDETEDSFIGNARIKAHAAAAATGLPALADDSGLTVDALDGAPGVYTADWAETPSGRDWMRAMGKVARLLDAKGAPEPRLAQFRCCLALAWPDGHDEVVEGACAGTLTWPPRGARGFGYDPMFVPEGGALTFAEMAPEKKHAISHRADAFRKLVAACFDPQGDV